MAGYEELAAIAAKEYREDGDGDEQTSLVECERCGAATTRKVCRKCKLVEAVNAV